MSTPDQPSPPLTRRQLRELRNTASTPVITPEEAAAAAAEEPRTPPPTPLPRAAEPISLPDAPPADVDLESTPATRRQARQQAKLRTATIGVVSAESADEHDEHDDATADAAEREDATPEHTEVAVDADAGDESSAESPPILVEGDDHLEDRLGALDESGASSTDGSDADAAVESPDDDDAAGAEVAPRHDESAIAERHPSDPVDGAESDSAEDAAGAGDAGPGSPDDTAGTGDADAAAEVAPDDAPVVAPAFGARLLAGEPGDVELPPSFDHLLTRGGGGGSTSAPNALILSQTPETGSLSVPIMGTGELLITGSYSLPENYGSTGTVPGAQDGKDLDAALIDGELPAASSPTPIAASSAVSTLKSADEIIRPPAPEKGSRLMMTLAITAGALALALATVLILAVVNGVL